MKLKQIPLSNPWCFRCMRCWYRTRTVALSSPGTLMWWGTTSCFASSGPRRLSMGWTNHLPPQPWVILVLSTWDLQPSQSSTQTLGGGGERERSTTGLRLLLSAMMGRVFRAAMSPSTLAPTFCSGHTLTGAHSVGSHLTCGTISHTPSTRLRSCSTVRCWTAWTTGAPWPACSPHTRASPASPRLPAIILLAGSAQECPVLYQKLVVLPSALSIREQQKVTSSPDGVQDQEVHQGVSRWTPSLDSTSSPPPVGPATNRNLLLQKRSASRHPWPFPKLEV